MAKNLTDSFLKSVEPPSAGRLEIADAGARGLVLRVTDSGVMSWAVRYRPKGKTQRRETIGAYPDFKLAEARQRARDIVAAASRGIDLPAEEIAKAEAETLAKERAITVATLLDRYLENHCKTNQRRPETVRRIFDLHVVPAIGNRPLADLRRAEIIELLDDLQNKKAMRAQVNRVRSQLIAALNWACERELIDSNPAASIKRRKIEKPRDRALSREELRAIWQTAEKLSDPSRAFVKYLILTGQRRDEVRCLEWAEIKGDIWTLPAKRNKGKRDHEVPLVAAVMEILDALPRSGRYVFSVDGKRPYAGTKRLKENIDRKAKVTGWVFHDIRRAVRSGLAELHVPEEVAERVLNHAQKGLVKTYNLHQYREEKRSALKAWANHVAFITSTAPSNVTPLARSAS